MAGRNRFLIVGLALAPFVCHCDPALEIQGSVHRPDEVPVVDAIVRTVCTPGESSYGDVSTTTDEDGNYHTEGLGTADDECRLEVLAMGEPTRRFHALDYCTDGDGTGCQHIEAHLTIPYPD